MRMLIDMFRGSPVLRAALWAALTCWILAGLLMVADVLNLITVPDHR